MTVVILNTKTMATHTVAKLTIVDHGSCEYISKKTTLSINYITMFSLQFYTKLDK